MDWLIWIIGGILLIGFVVGLYRGAVRIAVSIATAILTIAITFFVTPYLTQIVIDKTPLDDSIKESVINFMEKTAEQLLGGESDEPDDEENSGEDEADEMNQVSENAEIPRDIQIQAIEDAKLPDVFKNLLNENNNDEIYSELGVETFAQYAGTYLSRLLIHVATFLAVFLLVMIVLRAIVFALNIVNEIPVFGLTNRLAGGLLGGACALLAVWFIFIVVTLLYTSEIGKQMYDAIQGNDLTRLLYENNPLLNISIKF